MIYYFQYFDLFNEHIHFMITFEYVILFFFIELNMETDPIQIFADLTCCDLTCCSEYLFFALLSVDSSLHLLWVPD